MEMKCSVNSVDRNILTESAEENMTQDRPPNGNCVYD